MIHSIHIAEVSMLSGLKVATVAVCIALLLPHTGFAQGFPGGMGSGGMRGSGGGHRRGGNQEGGAGADTAATKNRLEGSTLADIALAHRTDLQLTDAQVTALGAVRARAQTSTAALTEKLDSVRSPSAAEPSIVAPPSDSSRVGLLERRRAVGGVLGELHDVDVNARAEAMRILTAEQQKKAAQLEEEAKNLPQSESRGSGRSGRSH